MAKIHIHVHKTNDIGGAHEQANVFIDRVKRAAQAIQRLRADDYRQAEEAVSDLKDLQDEINKALRALDKVG